MDMLNRKMRKFAAVAMSVSMMLAAGVVSHAYTGTALLEEDKGATLNIAGSEEAGEEKEEKAEAQTEAEPETEAPVVYDAIAPVDIGDSEIRVVDVSEVVKQALPTVVSITTESVQEVMDFFSGNVQEYKAIGAGSGVIVSQDEDELMIVTNYHIVRDSPDLTVAFSVDVDDEEKLIATAKVKGVDPSHDMAVIAVQLSDIDPEVLSQLRVATFGSSDAMEIGDAAIVIGNALGFGQTVTAGIISAKDREITTEIGTYNSLQIDAAINFGCSGGAIMNEKGQLIGFVDARDTVDEAEAMGYGIPVDDVIPVLSELVNREAREDLEEHGFIGVTVVPVSTDAQMMYNMPSGAFVSEVTEGSAAEEAGIRKGDIITKFDGVAVTSSGDLVNLVMKYAPGETVKVELVSSNGGEYESREVEVTLKAMDTDDKEESAKGEDQKDEGSEKEQGKPDDGFLDEKGIDDYMNGFGDFFFGE